MLVAHLVNKQNRNPYLLIPLTVLTQNPKMRVVTYKLFSTVHSSLRLTIKRMYVILRCCIYYSGGLSSDVSDVQRVTQTSGKGSGLGLSQLPPVDINHMTPNGHYMGRTAQLTSRCCILYIYSTNIRTEYFKHAA